MTKTIYQGAEARVILTDRGTVLKERISKSYRIRDIDEKLRSRRTKSEARLLNNARSAGVRTPQVFNIGKFDIEMEYIEGNKVKDILNSASQEEKELIAEKIGEAVGKLHSFGIVHGDLTTSNFILRNKELYLVDFGLGFHSNKIEDKAVDMHLLYQAIKSTHFNILKDVWELVLKAYARNYEDANNIVKHIEKIRERGRYK